jgi:hypothetical protein
LVNMRGVCIVTVGSVKGACGQWGGEYIYYIHMVCVWSKCLNNVDNRNVCGSEIGARVNTAGMYVQHEIVMVTI